MRNLDEVRNTLGYHPATTDTAGAHAAIRRMTIRLAEDSWSLIPDGPEKTLAMRALQQFCFHANCAIAVEGAPLDLATPEVARVFPGTDGPVSDVAT